MVGIAMGILPAMRLGSNISGAGQQEFPDHDAHCFWPPPAAPANPVHELLLVRVIALRSHYLTRKKTDELAHPFAKNIGW
jgi:hypothetical protein